MTKLVAVAFFVLSLTRRIDTSSKHCPHDGPPANKEGADIKTLEQVNVVWRHGARLPIYPTYPNDPYQDLSLWKHIGDDWGSLTVVGRQTQYELGSYLRRRYDKWLSEGYNPDEIYVQSSGFDRTIMCALCTMAGLWPVTPEDPKSQWNPDINWQPIPVRVIPLQEDYLIAVGSHCPLADEITTEYATNSTLAKSINSDPENIKFFEYMSIHTGETIKSFKDVMPIYSTLESDVVNGFLLPDWAKDYYNKMEYFASIYFSSKIYTPTLEAQRLRAGHLLFVLSTNMEARIGVSEPFSGSNSSAKMQAYSGHVDTLVPLLSALGVREFEEFPQEPPFSSAIIMELHKADPDQLDGVTDLRKHHVRLFWRNSTLVPPYELEIPACGFPCRLSTFKIVFDDILATRSEIIQACNALSANPEEVETN